MILYIWVIVAGGVGGMYDWQYAGKYDSPSACHQAAASLKVKQHRCISVSNGEVK